MGTLAYTFEQTEFLVVKLKEAGFTAQERGCIIDALECAITGVPFLRRHGTQSQEVLRNLGKARAVRDGNW